MKEPQKAARKGKTGHVLIQRAPWEIRPSPENDSLYQPVAPSDPDFQELVDSIKRIGVQEPIVITLDNYILSGHRRHAAAKVAGLASVPCRQLRVLRLGNPDFLKLLREFNRQRVKTHDEALREEIVALDPQQAHEQLVTEREERSRFKVETIFLRERRKRSEISEARLPFLNAAKRVIASLEEFWPLSNRQIHYQLLNDPPLIHAGKPGSRYKNNPASYKALSDLLTRARHEGLIDYDVIEDVTRPVSTWAVHRNTGAYFRVKLDDMFRDYWRDLTQSQPNHVEIVGEKLTIGRIIRPLASKYCLPMTIGRGYCSTGPLNNIVKRFRASGKELLVMLIISDFDPDGEEIAHSLACNLRDDFGVRNVQAVKVALKVEQTTDLPTSLTKAKPTSANYRRFVRTYGSDTVYELEALPPAELQGHLQEAIRGVLDIDAFNAELEKEKADAAHIEAARQRVLQALRDTNN